METVSALPADFINSLNEEQVIVEENADDSLDLQADVNGEGDRPDPTPEEFPELYEEDDEEKPGFLEEIEGSAEGEGIGIDPEEMDGFADLFVDMASMGKDLLEDYYDEAFAKALRRTYGPEHRFHLSVLQYADLHAALDIDGIGNTLDALKQRSEKFTDIEFHELLDMATDFVRLKKRYQAKPLKDYQREGIRRYAKKTIQKYLSKSNPNPLIMLALYMGVSFGGDGYRMYKIWSEDKQAEREFERTKQQAA